MRTNIKPNDWEGNSTYKRLREDLPDWQSILRDEGEAERVDEG